MSTPQAAVSTPVPATVNGSEAEVVTPTPVQPIAVNATITLTGLPAPAASVRDAVINRSSVPLFTTTVNWAAVVITFVFATLTAWLLLHNVVQPEVTQIIGVGQRVQATSLFTNVWVQLGLALGGAGLPACAAYVLTAQRTCQLVVCDNDDLRISLQN